MNASAWSADHLRTACQPVSGSATDSAPRPAPWQPTATVALSGAHGRRFSHETPCVTMQPTVKPAPLRRLV
jgi:hypothetical protein